MSFRIRIFNYATVAALTAAICTGAPTLAQTENCATVLTRVDSKLAAHAPHYMGTAMQAKILRDKGADHCKIGQESEAVAALIHAEKLLDGSN